LEAASVQAFCQYFPPLEAASVQAFCQSLVGQMRTPCLRFLIEMWHKKKINCDSKHLLKSSHQDAGKHRLVGFGQIDDAAPTQLVPRHNKLT